MKFSKKYLLIMSSLFVLCFGFLLLFGTFYCSRSSTKFRKSVDKYPRHYPGADIHAFSDVVEPIIGSYQDLSQFGSVEYECFGVCSCIDPSSDFESRRSLSRPIQKGISYIVVAVSSFVAYNAAKKHFDRKCEEKLGSECEDFQSVYSEVEDCEETKSKPDIIIGRNDRGVSMDYEPSMVEDKRFKEGRKYTCQGMCVEDDMFFLYMHQDVKDFMKDAIDGFDCERILGEEREIHFLPGMDVDLPHQLHEDTMLHQARVLYADRVLKDLCYKESLFSKNDVMNSFFESLDKSKKEEKKKSFDDLFTKLPNQIHFCIHPIFGETGLGDYVDCLFLGEFSDEEAEQWRKDELLKKDKKKKANKDDQSIDNIQSFKNEPNKNRNKKIIFSSQKDQKSAENSDPGLPSWEMDENFFKKQFQRLGVIERKYYENLYNEFIDYCADNDEEVPEETIQLSQMGKYQVISNLRIWMEKGGDPDLFSRDDDDDGEREGFFIDMKDE